MNINFAYHSIGYDKYVYSIQKGTFKKHITLINRLGIGIVKPSDLITGTNLSMPFSSIHFDDGLEDNLTNALPVLRELGVHATIFVATDFVGKKHTNAEGFTFKFLSWDQMRELEASGLVSIESHTHTHPLLTTLSDNELEYELAHSKQLIEDNLQKKVVGLAYPKGNFDERVKKFAAKYYEYATGPAGVLYDGETLDPYAIPRVIISRNIPLWKFRLMLSPLYWRARDVRDYLAGH